ncbi:hypothetical protein V2E38_12705, partial [Bifidobacterium longum subsp. infantis]|uniref:hypothetical protein n=1 Tax=Bifidobacterium longum TaxID=216816 RepID=UPI002EC17619|nr:hypothetical protein [Bifidobacterium longum subsp. infantis]
RIFDAVERPTVFPATVFVSVACGHLTLLAVGQVLQRSLEPAGPVVFGGNGTSRSILSLVSGVWLRRALGLRRVMGATGKAVGRIY